VNLEKVENNMKMKYRVRANRIRTKHILLPFPFHDLAKLKLNL
jgi:hypothetical protein